MPTSIIRERNQATSDALLDDRDRSSAVSWSAVLSGSFVTVAFMFVFFILGSGLGYAAASLHERPSHLTYMAAAWLIITQWITAGLGGYVTGRLRTKWVGVHTHEVFFRDTAHGLLSWAVATVFYTIVILSVASSVPDVSTSVTDTSASPASVALYTSLSMFVGAFISCIAAALGGIERDEPHPLL